MLLNLVTNVFKEKIYPNFQTKKFSTKLFGLAVVILNDLRRLVLATLYQVFHMSI